MKLLSPPALTRPRVQPPAWAPAPARSTYPTPASTARVGLLYKVNLYEPNLRTNPLGYLLACVRAKKILNVQNSTPIRLNQRISFEKFIGELERLLGAGTVQNINNMTQTDFEKLLESISKDPSSRIELGIYGKRLAWVGYLSGDSEPLTILENNVAESTLLINFDNFDVLCERFIKSAKQRHK
jgi:hypothetical protein